MIERLVVFGATGDLNARYLLPGLAALRAAGHLGDGFRLVCADRKDWDDEGFRGWVAEQLDRHAGSSPADARRWVARATRFQRADATDPTDLASLITGAAAATSAIPALMVGRIAIPVLPKRSIASCAWLAGFGTCAIASAMAVICWYGFIPARSSNDRFSAFSAAKADLSPDASRFSI